MQDVIPDGRATTPRFAETFIGGGGCVRVRASVWVPFCPRKGLRLNVDPWPTRCRVALPLGHTGGGGGGGGGGADANNEEDSERDRATPA